MVNQLGNITAWVHAQVHLLVPLILALWIAWGDIRTYRIPNSLTFATALGGLLFQLLFHGWTGLGNGCLGLLVGFFLLLPPYLLGGLGAGDVKALAGLGTWLGPHLTLILFCYMAVAGGLIALGVLLNKGLLLSKIRQGWSYLVNFLLCRQAGIQPSASDPKMETKGIPYGTAIALGMVVLFWRGG